MRFTSQVALVTGGASGIGAGVSEKLAAEGARVVIADIDAEGVERQAAAIRDAGGDAIGVVCDQTDDAQVTALFEETLARYDRLDVCHANAGWCRVDPFLDIRASTWRKHLDVNVTGTFLVCQAAARRMVECGNGGSIVVTSSSGAVQPAALFAAYSAAKASLNMMVSIMAYELGVHDIRVNAVMPGITETAMTSELLDTGARDMFEAEVPLGRLGRIPDISEVVAFLAGGESGYITGQSLLVDGGGGIPASWFVTDFSDRGRAKWQLRHMAQPAAVAEGGE